MNTLFKAIVLSISTALVAAPVMAAPQDHPNPAPSKHIPAPYQVKAAPNHPAAKAPQFNKQVKKVDPSRDWRVGQKVPQQFYTTSSKVSYTHYRKLHKPAKNQQWIKVNGDYILTNTVNHSIVKIIAG